MSQGLIRGMLASLALASSTSTPLQCGGGDPGQPMPVLGDLRSELFLPHYARMAGMWDELPARPGSAGLADGPRILVMARLELLSILADAEDVTAWRMEGRQVAADGLIDHDGVDTYAASILSADNDAQEVWRISVSSFTHEGIAPETANYLALAAMAPDIDDFEARHFGSVELPGPFSEPMMTIWAETTASMQILRSGVQAWDDVLSERLRGLTDAPSRAPDIEI